MTPHQTSPRGAKADFFSRVDSEEPTWARVDEVQLTPTQA